jgi:hypothetical protein
MTEVIGRHKDDNGWGWYQDKISVTTVLGNAVAKPSLTNWHIKNSQKKIQQTQAQAFDYGNRFHKAIEDTFNGLNAQVDQDFKPGFDNFLIWKDENNVKPLYIEKTISSQKYGFAGTADFIGYVNGELMIADWKTSKKYDITYGWQLGALRLAVQEELGLTCGLGGVQISKIDHQVKLFRYQHFEAVENAFLNALDVFKMLYWNKLDKLGYPWLHTKAMVRNENLVAIQTI